MGVKSNFSELLNSELTSIWKIAYDEGVDNELILNPFYIGFEMGKRILNINGNNDGKLEIIVSSNIECKFDKEYKIDVADLILEDYPEKNYYIQKIAAINPKLISEKLICDSLKIIVCTDNGNTQNIFIYFSIYGIQIGGSNKNEGWIKNWYEPMYGCEPEEVYF